MVQHPQNTVKVLVADLLDPEPYYDFHVPVYNNNWACGVLNHNCGKSFAAKATADLLDFPLIRLNVGALMGGIVGDTERNLREALARIEAAAPCVLQIDEMEKALAQGGGGDGGVMSRLFGELLTWLSDRQSRENPIFVVATANDVSALPPELLRRGRFDEVFFVDVPNHEEREEIFRIHMRKRNLPVPSDISGLVQLMNNFVGAEIESVVQEAQMIAFAQGVELSADLLKEVARKVKPQAKTQADKLEKTRVWASANARPASAGITAILPQSLPSPDAPVPSRRGGFQPRAQVRGVE